MSKLDSTNAQEFIDLLDKVKVTSPTFYDGGPLTLKLPDGSSIQFWKGCYQVWDNYAESDSCHDYREPIDYSDYGTQGQAMFMEWFKEESSGARRREQVAHAARKYEQTLKLHEANMKTILASTNLVPPSPEVSPEPKYSAAHAIPNKVDNRTLGEVIFETFFGRETGPTKKP